MPFFNISYFQIATVPHSNKAIIVDKSWPDHSPPKADGMVTALHNITLGALSADCPIILFADPDARIIETAHSGWKGARYGILESTVNKMIKSGANINNIYAVIGPSIFQSSYEVGPEFIDNFLKENSNNQQYFIVGTKQHHALFDLRSYLKQKLITLGLKSISEINKDTYQDEENYFSFRRTTHRHEQDLGCHLACIYLI